MKILLKPLTYPFNALEPFIDAQTVEIHHTKHHATYVNNLNMILEKYPEFEDKTLDELLTHPGLVGEADRQAFINQGGGVFNHDLYFHVMGPNSTKSPSGTLLKKIDETFTSFEKFSEDFAKLALGKFGSGWTWLVLDKETKLKIITTSNQDTPLANEFKPLLNLDVWEHAYYLKYQNRRNEYVQNWWNVISWDKVQELFDNAL